MAICVGRNEDFLRFREEKTTRHPRPADRAALMSRDLMSLPNPYGWERLTLAGYKRKVVARPSGENSSTFLHRVLREGIVQVQ